MATAKLKSLGLTIEGNKNVEKALNALAPTIAKKVLRKAMRQALQPTKRAVQDEAPVESGFTRKSVKLRAFKGSRKRIRMIVTIGEGFYLGKTYYAAFVEYGTSKMAANPFMRRAFDRTKDTAKKTAMILILDGALEAAKKSKKKK